MATKLWLAPRPKAAVRGAAPKLPARQKRLKLAEKLPNETLDADVLGSMQHVWLDYFAKIAALETGLGPPNELLLKCELVGAQVTVDFATNTNLVGLSGTVLNETRNMLLVQTSAARSVKLIKAAVGITVHAGKFGRFFVQCAALQRRPEKRLFSKMQISNFVIF